MNRKLSRRSPDISKRSKVQSEKPAYKEKKKTDKGFVWLYDEKHVEKRWKEKKEKMKGLEKNLQKVRAKYQADLTSDDEKTRAIAAIVGIMDDTAMRIGNEDSAKEGTYGATTLKVKHVKGGSSNITFDFPGKGAIEQNVVLKNNKVIKVVRDLMKGKKKDDFIFEIDGNKVWDRSVNRYLKEFGISAKDIRGFHANRLMKEQLKKKDFKDALKEVAEIVGHEEATLKNQYLDPELVAKYEDKGDKKDDKGKDKDSKKKKASISCRAIGETTNPMPELPESEEPDSAIQPIIMSNPDDYQNMIKMVNTNLNVNNAGDKLVFQHPGTQNAWRIIAPFLPSGARINSAFRDDFKQAAIFLKKWRSYGVSGWNKLWEGIFSNSEDGKPYNRFARKMQRKVDANTPFTKQDHRGFKAMGNIMYRVGKNTPKYQNFAVMRPGESEHAKDAAFDIGGVSDLNYSASIVQFVANSFPQNLQLNGKPFVEGPPQSAIHVELLSSTTLPDMKQYVPVLYRFLEKENRLALNVKNQTNNTHMISKRAELNEEDMKWLQGIKPNISSRMPTPAAGAQPDSKQKDLVNVDKATKKNMNIRGGAKLNYIIINGWATLRQFLPRGAALTSGFRTAEDQKKILNNYWKKATGKPIPEHLKSDDRVWGQVSKLLKKHHGLIVGPPWTKNKYAHLKGSAFDVSGANLDTIASAVNMISKDTSIPVKFRRPLIERKNNCVHIGIESAQYDKVAIQNALRSGRFASAIISKRANEPDINTCAIHEDLLNSNPSEDVINSFEDSFGMHVCAGDSWLDEMDMGFGLDDMQGDWFEKSPIFRNREEEDIPEHKIHDLSESEAKKLIKDDPEKFFYRGLHKEYPEFEAEALSNLIEDNAKFFFIFLYHEREEEEFQNLVEKAAELLSLQDVRAFFYYHLHHKFPELGRGAIVQLIDTNPDSFFDLGLQKDYPDLEESAGAARNIKDPNKVELEQPEWMKGDAEVGISVRDKNASISKRAGTLSSVISGHISIRLVRDISKRAGPGFSKNDLIGLYKLTYMRNELVKRSDKESLAAVKYLDSEIRDKLGATFSIFAGVFDTWLREHKAKFGDLNIAKDFNATSEWQLFTLLANNPEASNDEKLQEYKKRAEEDTLKWKKTFNTVEDINKELKSGITMNVEQDLALFNRAVGMSHIRGNMLDHLANTVDDPDDKVTTELMSALTSGEHEYMASWNRDLRKMSTNLLIKPISLRAKHNISHR